MLNNVIQTIRRDSAVVSPDCPSLSRSFSLRRFSVPYDAKCILSRYLAHIIRIIVLHQILPAVQHVRSPFPSVAMGIRADERYQFVLEQLMYESCHRMKPASEHTCRTLRQDTVGIHLQTDLITPQIPDPIRILKETPVALTMGQDHTISFVSNRADSLLYA